MKGRGEGGVREGEEVGMCREQHLHRVEKCIKLATDAAGTCITS